MTNLIQKVKVWVPKAFLLRLDHNTTVQYQQGVQEMPADHAEHWYSKVNGVTTNIPVLKTQPAVAAQPRSGPSADELEVALKDAQAQIASLRDLVPKAGEPSYTELQNRLALLTAERDGLASQMADLVADGTALKAQLATVTADRDAALAKVADLQAKLDAATKPADAAAPPSPADKPKPADKKADKPSSNRGK